MTRPAAIPLIVGVAGHRDLVEAELPTLRKQVRGFLEELRSTLPHTPIVVASQFAEGADLLVADEAASLGLGLLCLLPMDLESYRRSFSSAEQLEKFDALFARARVIHTGSGAQGANAPGQSELYPQSQYEAAGLLLARHCYILLALWDGNPATAPGGTGAVVQYRLASHRSSDPAQDLLPAGDNSLTYHIVTSRVRTNGAVAEGQQALAAGFVHEVAGSASVLEPRMPEMYRRVLARTEEFNAEAQRILKSEDEAGGGSSTVSTLAEPHLAIADCARLVNGADRLARHFRRNMQRAVAATYLAGAIMGGAFVFYSKAPLTYWYLIYPFVTFALIGLVASRFAARQQWHRKHLEYRAFAEALRVQFYWRLAGVRDEGRLHTGTDSFLRHQDADLEWIRNGLRAIDLELYDIAGRGIAGGIGLAIEQWVGGAIEAGQSRGAGQLAYYWHTALKKRRTVHSAELIGRTTLVFGLAAAFTLCFAPLLQVERMQLPLIIMMGLLPLAAGILEAYVQKSADRELARQYAYMYRLFDEARARLQNAARDEDRRAVLHALGRAALAEHATWVMLNRDRKLRHFGAH